MNGPMTEAMYYVLLSLAHPAHGYAMMQQIRTLSHGRVQMGPGTMYGLLSKMQTEGWIVLEESDGRRKTYALTEAGRAALLAEYERLQCLIRNGAFLKEREKSE